LNETFTETQLEILIQNKAGYSLLYSRSHLGVNRVCREERGGTLHMRGTSPGHVAAGVLAARGNDYIYVTLFKLFLLSTAVGKQMKVQCIPLR